MGFLKFWIATARPVANLLACCGSYTPRHEGEKADLRRMVKGMVTISHTELTMTCIHGDLHLLGGFQMKSTLFMVLGIVLLTTVPSVPASAAPKGLNPRCEPSYDRYAAATGPKAFAMGKTRSCGWWKLNDGIPMTFQEIKDRAVNQCRTMGGDDCRLVESSAK
jgi:hypothetical protein